MTAPAKLEHDLALCSRCGGCKALCPTYDDSCIESMGARGRLMIVRGLLNGSLKPEEPVCERLYSCTLCGACTPLCPLGIDIPEVIYYGRSLLKTADRRRNPLRRAVRLATRWPDFSHRLLLISRLFLLPTLAKKKLIPFLPDLPEHTLRATEQVYTVPKKKGRVAVFAGCSVNFFSPALGESLISVLQALGYEVVLPREEVCCGAPLRALGLDDEAAELAAKNERVFSKLKVEAILSLCPTCTMNLRVEYPKIIGRGLDRAMDISSFLSGRLPDIPSIGKTAVFHDPCHLKHGLGVTREPRAIISKAGFELREPLKSSCCGFGGTFCFTNRELSARLLERQSSNLVQSGADVIVTSCPGCMSYLGTAVSDRPIIHLIEMIEDAICWSANRKAPEGTHPGKAA